MELPDALKYSASHSTIRTNRFRLTPQGSDEVKPNGTVRVRLPEKSLVRLSSLSAYFNATVSGVVHSAGDTWSNALIPASYKFFRAVRFYVGGQIASGGLCNHYDQLYHALLISSADEAWCQSRFNEGYRELITGDDDDSVLGSPILNVTPGAGITSKTQYLTCSDFLGLPRCNGGGGVIDTSLFNSVEIEFVFNDDSILSCAKGAGANASISAITWSLDKFRVDVDCVVSVSPLYVEMMALRLAEATPIKFPYQNMVTTVSKNTGSNRIQVNTQSLDIMMVAPLRNNYNSKAEKTNNQMQPNRYKFDCKAGSAGGSNDNQNQYVTFAGTGKSLSLTVGSDQYPKLPIQNLLDVPDLTINTFYHGSLNSKNLFSQGLSAGVTQYHRSYGLSDNFVWANNFSLESEGWASRRLTGIDTSAQNVDIILNSTGFGEARDNVSHGNDGDSCYWLMCALISSQLLYDPSTATVSIIQ
jgi:hypothetical protein